MSDVVTEPGPTAARDSAGFFSDVLEGAPLTPLLVVVPAPLADPLRALRHLRKQDAWLLSRGASATGPSEVMLGLGSAWHAELRGGERLDTLRDELGQERALTRLVHPQAAASLAERLPLAFFGLAFAVGSATDEPWCDHGDGQLSSPRWTYLREGDEAVLAWSSGPRWSRQAEVARGELDAILAALAATLPTPGRPRAVGVERVSGERWAEHVEAARAAIGRGELHKVVAARRTIVSTARDLVPEEILAALPEAGATRFLVRRGTTTFLGATPELLFRRRGELVVTEALAGTRASSGEAAERGLLASRKDLDEHEPVLRAIVDALESLGARVETDAAPRIKHVANLVHLRTEIRATLGRRLGPTDLLRALHPTPAVGGAPSSAALAWIAAHERPRGWYAGPLGWVDARGDSDVHVALRSGVVRGARAWIYAGGGIVASSEPSAEYRETELKMAPLLRAVGAEPLLPAERSTTVERAGERAEARAERADVRPEQVAERSA